MFPDDQVAWLPFAILAALRAHRESPFDVLFSTSSPPTAHLVAGMLKRLLGVPWVAEFRDPWVGNPVEIATGRMPWLHRRLQVRLERWIARSADRIVVVTPGMNAMYRKRYPTAFEIETITNGHDESEFVRPAKDRQPGPFRLVWTGALYRPNELSVFMEGLHALAARRPGLARELEVVFYGPMTNACRAIADNYSCNQLIGSMVHFKAFVPRRLALQAMADADAALVILGAEPGLEYAIPGKLFDCLGQSQQVLAVLPSGDARNLLEELEWGVIAHPDVADIGRAIERLLTLPPPARPADPTGRYERSALVAHLAQTFERAARAHGTGR